MKTLLLRIEEITGNPSQQVVLYVKAHTAAGRLRQREATQSQFASQFVRGVIKGYDGNRLGRHFVESVVLAFVTVIADATYHQGAFGHRTG